MHINWKSWRVIRKLILIAICIALVAAHAAIGAFFVLLLWGIVAVGMLAWKKIYLGGLDRIAKKNADAIVAAQEKARRDNVRKLRDPGEL